MTRLLTPAEREFLQNLTHSLVLFTESARILTGLHSEGEIDVNDFITEKYPFDKSFDEMGIQEWADTSIKKINETLTKY
jgi:hypothetical protein